MFIHITLDNFYSACSCHIIIVTITFQWNTTELLKTRVISGIGLTGAVIDRQITVINFKKKMEGRLKTTNKQTNKQTKQTCYDKQHVFVLTCL